MKDKDFKKQSLRLHSEQAGFTLVEVLLIVAMFTIILSSAISLTTTQLFENDLSAKTLEVAALLETARSNSATGYRGDVWSIKVLDSDALCDNSGDCILLFKGRDFDDRETSYDRFVQFDSSSTGVYLNSDQENEFYFDSKSAWLATTSASYLDTQHIVLNSNFGEQQSIVIYPSGIASVFVCGEDKVFDADGNGYATVQIGSQCWMAENINRGIMLDSVSTEPTNDSIVEKWCHSDTASNCDIYGGLYNWNEAMAWDTVASGQGICPAGWHIPASVYILLLTTNYPSATAGYNLVLGGPSGFNLPYAGARDATIPSYNSSYDDLASLWSSTANTNATAYYVEDSTSPLIMYSGEFPKTWGLPVRCLKDY